MSAGNISARKPPAPQDVVAAWRFFQVTWVLIAAMAAALAFALVLTDFTIGVAGAMVAVCYVGVYAGFGWGFGAWAPVWDGGIAYRSSVTSAL